MWRCPSCGVPIEALYEARAMIDLIPDTQRPALRHKGTSPIPHRIIAQPCGCSLPVALGRTLATPHQ